VQPLHGSRFADASPACLQGCSGDVQHRDVGETSFDQAVDERRCPTTDIDHCGARTDPEKVDQLQGQLGLGLEPTHARDPAIAVSVVPMIRPGARAARSCTHLASPGWPKPKTGPMVTVLGTLPSCCTQPLVRVPPTTPGHCTHDERAPAAGGRDRLGDRQFDSRPVRRAGTRPGARHGCGVWGTVPSACAAASLGGPAAGSPP